MNAFRTSSLASRSHLTQGLLTITLALDDALLLLNLNSQILNQSSLPTGLHQPGAPSLQGKSQSP